MATSKKFSELPAASSVGNGDLFAIAHEDALAETGYVSQKLTAAQAGQKVNGDTEYPTSLPSFPENGQNPFSALEKLNQDIIDLYPVSTASGSIATFDTSLALPLVECKAEIVAKQAGSGTPSPSNPRAISGYDEVVLTHTGKNLFNPLTQFSELSAYLIAKNVLPKAKCNMSFVDKDTSVDISGIYFGFCDSNYNGGTLSQGTYNWTINNGVIQQYTTNVTSLMTCTALVAYPKNQTTIDKILQRFDIQIELGNHSTTYDDFTGDTFTIALGQTVYGGSVDCINGTGMKTVKYFSFSEAQYYGTYGVDNANLYYVEIPDYSTEKIKLYNDTTAPDCILISNLFVKTTGSNSSRMGDNEFRTQAGATPRYFYFRADSFADLAAVNAFLAVTPLQVVAELQTPVEITGLTPANFTTIAGENNIFADSGDVEVSFKQGIQEYIDAKIAETQALIL